MLRGRLTRRRDARDRGYNLVELLVTMSIFSVLIAMIFGLFVTMTFQARDNLARVRSVEQARLGLSQIDRQIRSGNVILDPADDGQDEAGVDANYSLRVYTQEDGDDKCVQWRVIFKDSASDFGELEFREWEAGNPSSVSPWSTVASNVMAPAVAFDENDPESWPPFWVDTRLTTGTKAQNVRVTLRMGDPRADEGAKPATVSTVVTGRNTVFGYATGNCATVPDP